MKNVLFCLHIFNPASFVNCTYVLADLGVALIIIIIIVV